MKASHQTSTVGRRQQHWVIAATTLASGMAFLAGSAVTVALPVIQETFEASLASVQWIVNVFALALAALILVAGALGDRYGKRAVFASGIAVFTVASGFSALAPSVAWLVAFQGIAGVGAAFMIPGSLAILGTCIPQDQRGRAIGLWAGLSGALAALGPFAGGLLTAQLGWPAVFAVNVPIGLIALAVTFRGIPILTPVERQPVDVTGMTLVAVALAAFSYFLVGVGERGFTAASWIALGVMTVAVVILVPVERRAAAPAVPYRLLRYRHVLGANAATLALYTALSGTIFFLSFDLQQVQDYGPALAGAGLLPPVVLISLLSGYGGALADRIGVRIPMLVGPVLVAAGFTLLAFHGPEARYAYHILPGLSLFGVGMALVIAAITKTALAVPEAQTGVASGLNNAVSRFAALLAYTALGAVMALSFSATLDRELASRDLPAGVVQAVRAESGRLAAIDASGYAPSVAARIESAVDAAFMSGFRRVMAVNAALALAAAVLAWFTICRAPARKVVGDADTEIAAAICAQE